MVRLIGVEPKGEGRVHYVAQNKTWGGKHIRKGAHYVLDMETYDEPGTAGGEANVKKTIKL